MKTNKSLQLKKWIYTSILLFAAFGFFVNPLNYIMGSETNGLDMVYLILGISAILMLLFFKGYNAEDKEEAVAIKPMNPDENFHRRKVIRKTS